MMGEQGLFQTINNKKNSIIMEYKQAGIEDIDGVLQLHNRYQIDTILEEDKKDGFVTTSFTKEQLIKLIEEENGLFIAKEGEHVVAYAMAASWSFWSNWPIFIYMIDNLSKFNYTGELLTTENSYQYGPVCVDKEYRGSGVVAGIFEYSWGIMSKRFRILVTFINKKNPRSFNAHSKKIGLDVIGEFEFNGNNYYELAYKG
jgi:hypothetical protein